MKKLLLFLLLTLPALGQSFSGRSSGDIFITPPYKVCLGDDNGQNACFIQSGSKIVRFSGSLDFQLATQTVSTLPAAAANLGRIYLVTDAQSATDCTGGGGAQASVCVSNGTLWQSISSTTAITPTGAQLCVSPTTFNFGTVQTNTDSTILLPVAISNCGNTGVSVNLPTISGSTDFRGTPNLNTCVGALPIGETCNQLILLHPTISGAEPSTTLTVSSTAPVDPLNPPTVILNGSGTATPTFTLSVNASGTMTGSGIVTSNEATPLINCRLVAGSPPASIPPGSCSSNYASGATPILTAFPDPGHTFGGFSGGGCSTSPCTVTISAATTVTATFTAPIPQFILRMACAGQGTGTIVSDLNDVITGTPINTTCTAGQISGKVTGTFNQGQAPILTETPSAGCSGGACTFTSWGGAPNCTTASTCQVTVNSNQTVSAGFALPPAGAPIQLIQSINGGSTSGTWAYVTRADNAACANATTCAVTVPSTGSGHLLVGVASTANNVTISSVSGGGSWVLCAASACHINGNIDAAYVLSSSSGTTTVTFTFSGTSGGGTVSVLEYSYTNGPIAFDVAGTAANTTNTTPPGIGLSLAGGNELIVQYITNTGVTTFTGINGCYSSPLDLVATFTGIAGCVNTNSGTAPTWTQNTNSLTKAGALAFKETSTTVSGTFASAQTTGDTNIVYVQWNDAASTVSAITDTSGNSYTQSACSPKAGNGLSEALYYSPSILSAGAGANTIKVTLTGSPTIRSILGTEYSGLTATPVDVCAGANGASGNPASGNLTTNFANDLLTAGAQLVVGHNISAVSSGWTQRVTASGSDVEDQQGVAIGTYASSPTQNSSGAWNDIAAAWKNAGGGAPTNFVVTVNCGGTGNGTVTASGINVTCTASSPSGGPFSVSVAPNSTLNLTATPLTGSSFTTYNGGNCGTNPSCLTAAITTNITITATFGSVGAQNFFINFGTGSDSNDGLAATVGGGHGPWATFAKAEAALTLGPGGSCTALGSGWPTAPYTRGNVGACVHVNGTFSPSVGSCLTDSMPLALCGTRNGTPTARIVFVSDTYHGARINGAFKTRGDNVSFIGFEVVCSACDSGIWFGFGNGPAYQGSSNLGFNDEARFNYVHDTGMTYAGGNSVSVGCPTAGAIQSTYAPSGVVIDSNIIDHYAATPINEGAVATCHEAHGIYVAGPNNTVTNNVISRAAGGAIHLYHNTCHEVVSNNTAYNNYSFGIDVSSGTAADGAGDPIQCGGANTNTAVNNNLVVNNGNASNFQLWGMREYSGNPSSNTFNNNLLIGNLPDNSIPWVSGSTNLPITPPASDTFSSNLCTGTRCAAATSATTSSLFVTYNGTAVGANMREKAGAQSINAGTSTKCAASPGQAICAPVQDADQNNRPIGPAPDIGAYEQ